MDVWEGVVTEQFMVNAMILLGMRWFCMRGLSD